MRRTTPHVTTCEVKNCTKKVVSGSKKCTDHSGARVCNWLKCSEWAAAGHEKCGKHGGKNA
ncbi:hypothetical protein EHS25_001045 [Saitozyma podzolica]|uniref:Uncharacterized protein n=1 Tax=Saitozyma podzolica TaxID=1890683 RepID=A0A427YH93_9TREE|nr:hypothetical protein EHS25_001045 [Saitozyma podzolica]